jgi:hypothetical protein
MSFSKMENKNVKQSCLEVGTSQRREDIRKCKRVNMVKICTHMKMEKRDLLKQF